LVKLVDCIPMPRPPSRRGPGHPKVYSDGLFLKALIIMIVRHLHKVHELLAVVAQPTAEMQALRTFADGDRTLSLPTHMGAALESHARQLARADRMLGRYLVILIQPWATCRG